MIKNSGAAWALLMLTSLAGTALWMDVSSQHYHCDDNAHGCDVTTYVVFPHIDYTTGVLAAAEFLEKHDGAVSAAAGIVVAVFTMILAWKTWGLHAATRGLQESAKLQSEDTKQSITQATRAALAMEQIAKGIGDTVAINRLVVDNQKEFWARQMRAYISVDIGNYLRQSRKLKFEFRPNLINNGNTPANNVRVISKCEIIESVPADFDYAISPGEGGLVSSMSLFPRQTKFHSNVFHRKCGVREMRALLIGKQFFHLWGTVTYEDIFEISRTTNFSFLLFIPINKKGTVVWHTTDKHNDAN